MKTTQNYQCPNCWGYQVYDEQHLEVCKNEQV